MADGASTSPTAVAGHAAAGTFLAGWAFPASIAHLPAAMATAAQRACAVRPRDIDLDFWDPGLTWCQLVWVDIILLFDHAWDQFIFDACFVNDYGCFSFRFIEVLFFSKSSNIYFHFVQSFFWHGDISSLHWNLVEILVWHDRILPYPWNR